MKQNIQYGIGGILIGALVVFFGFKLGAENYLMGSEGTGNERMMGAQNSEVMDAHFIEQMIPHHEDAITMSKIALQKGQRPEIKTLARNIIDSQSKEIEQMRNWYKTWYGRELPTGSEVMNQHGMMGNTGMHMGMMGNEMDLDRLEEAEDFDRAFLEEMIPHHQMAVMMASMLNRGTTRPEMKQLADDIITAQTTEIDQMREWLRDWSK